jgi:hypothetical protein
MIAVGAPSFRVLCERVGSTDPDSKPRTKAVYVRASLLAASVTIKYKRSLVKRKLLALPLAIALGLEIIAPGGEEQHPHTEKEIILAPEPEGSDADSLRPLTTPPENPWLSDYALRVTNTEGLEGWWVNTATTHALVVW